MNVVFNNFRQRRVTPGTYIHVIVLWAVFQAVNASATVLLFSLFVEIKAADADGRRLSPTCWCQTGSPCCCLVTFRRCDGRLRQRTRVEGAVWSSPITALVAFLAA